MHYLKVYSLKYVGFCFSECSLVDAVNYSVFQGYYSHFQTISLSLLKVIFKRHFNPQMSTVK